MKRLFAELARRQVFRVAAAYAIVGWVALQIIGLLAPNLGLPEWTVALVFVILLVGFPLAILLTWAFELTPDGVKKTQASGDDVASGVSKTDLGLIASVIVLAAVSLFATSRPGLPTDEPEALPVANGMGDQGIPGFSVAILPLDNLSDEGALGWIADGISEDITTRIASWQTLRVAARNSSFAYKGKATDIRVVGTNLNVRFVLEGSLHMVGNDLRITAQLIDTETGGHVWTDNYTHPMTDIATIQDKVVDVISADVYYTILDREIKRISGEPVEGLSSFELTFLAISKAFFQPPTIEGGRDGAALLKAAIDADPGNMFAHGTLAVVYCYQYRFSHPRVESHKELALQHIQVPLNAAPHDFWTLSRAGSVFALLGKHSESLRYAERAIELYPQMSLPWFGLAQTQIGLGNFPAALDAHRRAVELSGSRPVNYQVLLGQRAGILLGLGDFEAAEAAAAETLGYQESVWVRPTLITALVRRGKLDEAQAALEIYKQDPLAHTLAELEADLREAYENEHYVDEIVESMRAAGLE